MKIPKIARPFYPQNPKIPKVARPLYPQNPHLSLALFLIDSNGFFDYRACGHLLQHCANHSLFFQGKQIHARLILLSVIPDNFLASKLVSMYSKSGQIHHASKVFDEIPHRNIFSFNAMLIAYSSHDQHSEALRLFSSLASFKPALKPDSFTISSLLKALSSVPLPHPILDFSSMQ